MTTRPSAEAIEAMARISGVPMDAATAARIANSIGPAFDAFAGAAGTLPLDVEPATFIVTQHAKATS